MNREKEIVLRHLWQMGFQDVRHEPDGNVPPDLLIDAITLVQNFFEELRQRVPTT